MGAVRKLKRRATPKHKRWLGNELPVEMRRFIQTQRSRHTQRAYQADLNQFAEFLLDVGLPGNDFDALIAYRDWLVRPKHDDGAGLSRVSANRRFSTVRAFLTFLQMRGRISENPAGLIKSFRAQNESPTQAFSDEEVERILSLPRLNTPSGRAHRLILEMLFFLGLRRGEVCALQGRHVSLMRSEGENILTLRVPGKGDKERLIPLPERISTRLMDHMAEHKIESGSKTYLFRPVRNNVTKDFSRPISTQAVFYIVRKFAKLAGIRKRVSPHSCRATCISNALDHKASHRAVMELAGWSSPLMIATYDKRREALKSSAVYLVQYSEKKPATV